MLNCYTSSPDSTIPIISLTEKSFSAWLEFQSVFTKNWIKTQNFTAKPNTICQVPTSDGKLDKVLVGQRDENDVFILGNLSTALPKENYSLEIFHPLSALAWGMGAYQFTKYKASNKTINQLFLPKEHQYLIHQIKAIYLVRDLINTPTEEMGPKELAETTERMAKEFGAEFNQIIGDELLSNNYPAIHTVGRASTNPPRLIDLQWGDKNAPKVTLIGKGVCFDSGGLDIKPSSNMLLMKKDMGGAAHVLGLAYLIMSANLPIRLRVLIPAVENVISGNAYKPGDVIKTRKGLTVEIGNTDAEGRVVLSDALAEASSEQPELIIDIATLTGAARVALGTDLPALFTNDDNLANELINISNNIQDPIWRMPLHTPYRKLLDSNIADINNAGGSGYAGAITAALFLKEFVPEKTSWAHFDLMAWNLSSTPSHPEGGEAMALRTIYTYLENRFRARSSAG
jgi:leucyl aminopeptidase